jgi:hypothetical protein
MLAFRECGLRFGLTDQWSMWTVDINAGGELPIEGDFVNDAEPETSARHAVIEDDGADEPMR